MGKKVIYLPTDTLVCCVVFVDSLLESESLRFFLFDPSSSTDSGSVESGVSGKDLLLPWLWGLGVSSWVVDTLATATFKDPEVSSRIKETNQKKNPERVSHIDQIPSLLTETGLLTGFSTLVVVSLVSFFSSDNLFEGSIISVL